jgi:TolA protein
MHRSPGILFLTLLLGLALFSITAQATRVTVRAVLPNGGGAGPGVDVVVTNNTGYRTSGVTNKQSRVRFSNVPEGNQTITVERSNERGQWQGNVRGKNQNVKVTLTNVSQTIPSAAAAASAKVEAERAAALEAERQRETEEAARLEEQRQADAEAARLKEEAQEKLEAEARAQAEADAAAEKAAQEEAERLATEEAERLKAEEQEKAEAEARAQAEAAQEEADRLAAEEAERLKAEEQATAEAEAAAEAATTAAQPSAPTAPSAALRINDGADCVIVDGVVLANTVTGPAPKGYRASEDRSLIRTAPWTLYSARPPFTLSAGAGKKTVYFQVQSPVAGTLVDSEIVSDTINRVAPRSSAVFNINNGAPTTFNRTVTLNNTASFTPSGPNPRYLASEDPNFAGAQWQAYGTEPQFTLSAGTGSKTVYFMASREVCGRVVATPPVSDTIEIPQVTVGAPPATETVIAEPVRPIVPPPVALRSFEFINDRGKSVNPLTPAEVIAYAGSQGFTHSASLTRGDGSCNRESNVATDYVDRQVQAWFLARPRWTQDLGSTQVEYLTCEFNLFGSRRLNPGWRVVSVSVGQMEISPWSGIVQVKALPSADNLNFTIVVPLPGIECGIALFKLCPASLTLIGDTFLDTATGIDVKTVDQVAFIEKLVIEGPTNDWHDAFRR